MSIVKDSTLAEQGKKQIEWAEMQMSGLMSVRSRFARDRPLAGLRIGMALHLTKETAALVRTLAAGGATIAIASCNPLSTQDDVAAALAAEGFAVFGKKGETKEEYYDYLNRVLETKPQITIDDGMELVTLIHSKKPELIKDIIGGAEETTTGVQRLRAMHKDGALKYPVIAVNDSATKHLVDNFYGTGQSSLDGIIRATNILIAGKSFVVCGYGDCGKGVAARAKALGANVIVTEVKPFRALQAHLDGHRVMPLAEASKIGDIFITVTGNKNVIDLAHLKAMKNGAIVCNSGHFDAEINMAALTKQAKSKRLIRQSMEEYVLDGKKIFVLGEGRLVNLAAAEGHPSDVMNFSFCDQALAVEYIVKNRGLAPGVYELPEALDDEVAKLQLDAWGVKFDNLTDEQKKYVGSWKEGT